MNTAATLEYAPRQSWFGRAEGLVRQKWKRRLADRHGIWFHLFLAYWSGPSCLYDLE